MAAEIGGFPPIVRMRSRPGINCPIALCALAFRIKSPYTPLNPPRKIATDILDEVGRSQLVSNLKRARNRRGPARVAC